MVATLVVGLIAAVPAILPLARVLARLVEVAR